MTPATLAEPLLAEAEQLFADEAIQVRAIASGDLAVEDWVRTKCQYGCLNYGKNLSCPPFSQEPDATRRMLSEYSWALWITGETDYQVAEASWRLESTAFFLGYYKAFGMAAGPCKLCPTCDLSNGCRFPNRARPAMEALGINVITTAEAFGYTPRIVQPGEWCTQFFGCVLVD